MKQIVTIVSALLLSSIFMDSIAQDTTVVQTLTFQDITKRRDVFSFPDDSKKYRRILMRYNLKCDPQTQQDQYDCGEWDYLSYIYVYGHDGVLDSTRRTGPDFRVNNTTPTTFSYTPNPLYDVWREKQYTINHTNTSSVSRDTVGSGTVSLANVLDLAKKSGRSQFIWLSSELTSAGLTSGDITGIQLDVSQLGSAIDNFEIKFGHTSATSLSNGQFINTGLNSVYKHATNLSSTGFVDLQFPTPFTWNGTDNLVIEFSFKGQGGTAVELNGATQSFDAGASTGGSNSYLEFRGSQNWVNMGRGPQVSGNGARTIECWAKINQFNNAGLFQAGTSGRGKDFTLRTTNTDDKFRGQLWGTGLDFDFTYAGAKGAWHHYVMSYDGTTARVYIDGQLVTSKTAAINTANMDFRLGRWQGSYLQGDIDEVRMWDKALSQSTIEAWMTKSVDNTHPDYANLIGYYDLNENQGLNVNDKSPQGNAPGLLSGVPWWRMSEPDMLVLNTMVTKDRPNVVFEKGVYTSVLDSTYVYDTLNRKPANLIIYGNVASGVQIPDNDPNHPSLPTQNRTVWEADRNMYTISKNTGDTIGQKFIANDSTITNATKVWFTPEYRVEIGRYITPYGKGLDLGPDGFVWWYDVTDYVQFLQDSVDLKAGDQLELIDLQFLFIEGTPAREVININRVWGQNGSKRYRDLDNDAALSEVTVPLDPNSEYVKVKMRFTGHGHNSDDGSYPHCCEWKDNEHSLIIDGQPFSSWHIWQTHDCAENPVYPQGGTWNGSREGWCPGDVVKDNEFEVGFLVSGSSFKMDYDITDVPANNQGMGNGNYQVAVHVVQYTEAAFKNDVEVLEVQTPTSEGIHSRKGSVCDNPKVVIRNGGSEVLKKCEIRYRVGDGDIRSFNWTGTLRMMDTEVVELPVNDEGFYSGNGTVGFEVTASNPNGVGDEYRDNNTVVAMYEVPVQYEAKIAVRLRTNMRPQENWYMVKNIEGDTVILKNNLTANTTYTDTLDLPEGCYSFYMRDNGNDGLSYWANSAQGSGSVQFWVFDVGGNLQSVKTFEPDFGRHLNFSFTAKQDLGDYPVDNPSDLEWDGWELWPTEVAEIDHDLTMAVYPNPTTGNVVIELFGMTGEYKIGVYSSLGEKVMERQVVGDDFLRTDIDLSGSSDGVYYLRVESANGIQVKRIILEK